MDDASPPSSPAAPATGRPVILYLFCVLFVLTAVVHAAVGLARDRLPPNPFGLLLTSLVVAGTVTFVVAIARDVRAGRWVQAGVAAVACSLLVLAVGSGWLARRMLFPGCPRALPAPGQCSLGEVVAYETEDGITLRGLLVRAEREEGAPPPPALVYFHGNAESAADNADTARDLARAGCDVFVAEFRGYGGCGGSPTEEGLLADGRAALGVVERLLQVPPGRVVLVGRSLGTGVAAGLAAEGAGRAVVLISPYTSIVELAGQLASAPLAHLAVRDRFDSLTALRGASQPVLVIHGTRDEVIPYGMGQRLAGALGERARLVTLEGVGHNDVFLHAGERVVSETRTFACQGG